MLDAHSISIGHHLAQQRVVHNAMLCNKQAVCTAVHAGHNCSVCSSTTPACMMAEQRLAVMLRWTYGAMMSAPYIHQAGKVQKLKCVCVCRELCVVSSAWSKAVEGLLDNIDTYPGLSSDWAEEGSRFGEARVSTAPLFCGSCHLASVPVVLCWTGDSFLYHVAS